MAIVGAATAMRPGPQMFLWTVHLDFILLNRWAAFEYAYSHARGQWKSVYVNEPFCRVTECTYNNDDTLKLTTINRYLIFFPSCSFFAITVFDARAFSLCSRGCSIHGSFACLCMTYCHFEYFAARFFSGLIAIQIRINICKNVHVFVFLIVFNFSTVLDVVDIDDESCSQNFDRSLVNMLLGYSNTRRTNSWMIHNLPCWLMFARKMVAAIAVEDCSLGDSFLYRCDWFFCVFLSLF